MRVLQFGFSTGAEAEKHLPHRFVPHCVVYTGTHDNDTARGWLTSSAGPDHAVSRRRSRPSGPTPCATSGRAGKEFHWDMIRLAFGSVADIAIIPMQDVLGLDSSARMNVPGEGRGQLGLAITAPSSSPPKVKHVWPR